MSEIDRAALEESGYELFEQVKTLLKQQVMGIAQGSNVAYEFRSNVKDQMQVLKPSNLPGQNTSMREAVFLEYRSHSRRIEGEVGEQRVSIKLQERNGKLIYPDNDIREFVSDIVLQLPRL